MSKISEYSLDGRNVHPLIPFKEEVNKLEYKDYFKHIQYEIWFLKVLKKLKRGIYHSMNAVL